MTLASATDIDGFRGRLPRALGGAVGPASVEWHSADDHEGDVLAAAADPLPRQAVTDAPLRVPADFLDLWKRVVLHRAPIASAALPTALRLQTEPALRHDALDADRLQASGLAHACSATCTK